MSALVPAYAQDVIVSTCDFASLREAFITANENDGTITFICSGTITFRHELTTTGNIHIIGAGNIIFNGGLATQFFAVNRYTSLTLDGLTLQYGYHEEQGGAIDNDGTLIITNSAFLNNTSGRTDQLNFGGGGAIYNNGILTISNSVFSLNRANDGGAIYNSGGSVSIINSIFSENAARLTGGAIKNHHGTFSINNSRIVNNTTYNDNGSAIVSLENNIVSSQNTHYENNNCDGGAIIDNGGNIAQNANGCPNSLPTTSPFTLTVSDCIHFTGIGTLSDAIANANNNGGIITFTCNETIIFTDVLTITGNVIINGTGFIFFDGDDRTQLFRVDEGANLTLDGVTLQNGIDAHGGAIINNGTASISNSIFSRNASAGGGAIYNNGLITIINSTFTNNSTGGSGGAISNNGTLTIIGGIFNGNSAATWDYYYGGAIDNAGTLTIIDSIFSGNFAKDGGAIANDGQLAITNSTFTDNLAGNGGAILNRSRLTIVGSTFDRNVTRKMIGLYGNGGAIANHARLAITDSTFTDNLAQFNGGAIFNENFSEGYILISGLLTISGTTFSHNVANMGGAIFNSDLMTITQSTFTTNMAIGESDAINNSGTLFSNHVHYENNACGGTGVFIDDGGNTIDNAYGCPNN
ncbi:MAG: hypothetical protein SFZ02_12600 [bacterium]|nr:hypothetical protein [bacterium]